MLEWLSGILTLGLHLEYRDMKKILALIASFALLISARGATIQWYSQQTPTTTIAGSDIFSMEAPYRAGYKWIDFNGLKYNLYDPNPLFSSISITNTATGAINFTNALGNYVQFTVSDTAPNTTLVFPDCLLFGGVWTNTGSLIVPTTVLPVDVSYIASGPKSHLWYNVEVDSDATPNAYAQSFIDAQYFTGSGAAQSGIDLKSKSSGGNTAEIIFNAAAANASPTPTFTILTNSQATFGVDKDGVESANGHIDRSLTPGALVTVDNTFRLISTNTAFIYNFYSSNFFTTNLFAQFITNQYAYITNLYTSNAFITNLSVVYLTNQYAYITNLYTSNFFTTNLFAYFSTNEYAYITNLWTSNAFITNITAKKIDVTIINAGDVIVTNNIYFWTNSWAGPTNTIPLWLARQRYIASGPVSITGFTGKSNYVTEDVLLTISNSSGANITVDLPAGVTTGNGTNTYVITNATAGKLWIQYDPNGETNAVFRWFK